MMLLLALLMAAPPELVVQTGHAGIIASIAFSQDGAFLVSTGSNKIAYVWDLGTGKRVSAFTDEASASKEVGALFHEVAGKLPNAIRSNNGRNEAQFEVRLDGGQAARRFKVYDSGYVGDHALSANGGLLAVTGSDSNIRVYETASGNLRYTFGKLASRMFNAAFSPNGKLFATGGGENGKYGEVRLWDLSTAKLAKRLGPYQDIITTLEFSPDGRKLYVGISTGQGVREIDLETFAERTLFTGPVNSINLSADGKRLALGGNKGLEKQHVQVLDVASGKVLCETRGFTAALSADGLRFASLAFRDSIAFYAVDGCKKLGTASAPEENITTTSNPRLLSIATSAGVTLIDNKTFATTSIPSLHNGSAIGGADVSPDGSLLATAGWDYKVHLWDLKKKKIVHTMLGHEAELREARFSNDGKTLATAADDTRTILWDVATGKVRATLIGIAKTDEYVIYTPDSFYTLSRGATSAVAFRMGKRAYPFEQFDLKLNRPDRVLKTLGVASPALIDMYAKAYTKRLAKMGFTEAQLGDDLHLPDIAVDTRTLPPSTKDASVSLAVTASDERDTIDRLLVWVNDVPVRSAEFDVRVAKAKKITRTISIALSQGRNKIQVAALGSHGVESLRETVFIEKVGEAKKPNAYVVVIGVSQYRDASMNLQYASKDANDVADALIGNKTRFNEVKVLRLLDAKATKEAITQAKDFVMPSQVDDVVVVFIAGHGLLDDHDYYFATHDIDIAHPAERGASYALIESLLDGIAARQKLLLMDTCNSGEVDASATLVAVADNVSKEGTVKTRGVKLKAVGQPLGMKDSFALLQELFLDLRRGSGAVVISSAGGTEQALESDAWHNGVFTYALLEGLKTKSADANKDGAMRVSEVREYVLQKVLALTNGAQRPTTRQDNLDFDYVVY